MPALCLCKVVLLMTAVPAVPCCLQVAEDVFRIAGRDPLIEVAIALQVCSHCLTESCAMPPMLHAPLTYSPASTYNIGRQLLSAHAHHLGCCDVFVSDGAAAAAAAA